MIHPLGSPGGHDLTNTDTRNGKGSNKTNSAALTSRYDDKEEIRLLEIVAFNVSNFVH